MLPGLHRVRKLNKSGPTEYWYAWRGGPLILKVTGKSDADLARQVSIEAPTAIQAFKDKQAQPKSPVTLYELITRYLTFIADDKALSARTLRDRRTYLDRVREELGGMELRALQSKRARAGLIDWRDSKKATPKTADELLNALSQVLEWAVDRGEIPTNPAKNFPRIYAVDRAEVIWEEQHLATLLAEAAPEFGNFVNVAIFSGMRLGDLRKLSWSMVGEDAIVFQTGKSNRRRTAVVPITDQLRAALAEIPKKDSVTVLNSVRGRPWSEAGLESAMQRAKRDALAKAKELHGDDATSGIEHLRIHDFRGTAATNFMLAGLEDDDVATIMGWKRERVAEIRRRYVSGQAIGRAIVQRLKWNKARTDSVN